jgi:hypothetical protein
MAINPKCDHTHLVSWSPNQKTPIKFHLCLELFVFLFVLFQAEHLINMVTTSSWSSSICFTTWNIYQPISHTLRAHRLVARVSSIHYNQTRAFNRAYQFYRFENWHVFVRKRKVNGLCPSMLTFLVLHHVFQSLRTLSYTYWPLTKSISTVFVKPTL